jgi:hypothetical protein
MSAAATIMLSGSSSISGAAALLAGFGGILAQSLMITAFVAVMMILVEYGNILSLNRLRSLLCASCWVQYVAPAILGAIPGCLGAFAVVVLYIHRSLRLGAVVACMVATSGDEAFVMLALFPRTALWLTVGLLVAGVIAGVLTDLFRPSASTDDACVDMQLHDAIPSCRCFDAATILTELRSPSAARGALMGGTILFGWAVLSGSIGPPQWSWIRVTLLVAAVITLFVVVTVPEHFITEHLWQHVVLGHLPRLFAWTLGAMILVALLQSSFDLSTTVQENPWLMLMAGAAIGIVPESGPHLIVVMLYAAGSVPLSVLVASSIVQDGHGMLPMLAHSRRDFLLIKAINLVLAVLVGAVMMLLGW